MKDHNRPAENMTDGRCGPNNGPNCAACRVFKTKLSEKAINMGVWQGMNGYFYCVKYFGVQEKGHDGFCWPNNGVPCPSCYKLLLSCLI